MINQITEFDIHALIDNELCWDEEKRVRDQVFSDPAALKKYQNLKNQKKLLNLLWYIDEVN